MNELNKKGQGVTLRTFLIGFILVFMVVAIGGNYVNNILYNYEIGADSNLSSFYGGFNKTLQNASYGFGEDFQGNLSNQGGENLNIIGGEAGVLKTMYNVIKMPFDILPDITNIIEIAGKIIGIPGWVVKPLLGIIMILLAAIILGIIFRSTST